MKLKIVLLTAMLALSGPVHAAGVATAAEAKALVEGLLEASRTHNQIKFVTYIESNARIAVGPPDAAPPLFQRLDMRRFEDVLKGCEVLAVSAGSRTTVQLDTRCPGKGARKSYFILRNGKVSVFYPFRPPAVMMAPPA